MKPPSAMTRFFGTPKVAAVLYIGSGLTVLGWMSGAVPWWLGIIALFFLGTVHNDVLKVRRYDAWFAEWQAIAGYSAPERAVKKPPSRGRLGAQAIGFAFVAWVIWNSVPPGYKPSQGQSVMWGLMMGGFVWSTCRLIAAARHVRTQVERAGKSRAEAKNTTSADVVEWALPPASASPSRSDAMRRLPEYAARLLTPGGGT